MAVTIRYAELRAQGATHRRIEAAVAAGDLIRVRRGVYVGALCPPAALAAARHGGRVDCLTLLASLRIFVLANRVLHVQMDYGSTRVPARSDRVVRHWRSTVAHPAALMAPMIEALAQACRCQSPRAAIATLDSAWHLGFVDEAGIAEVFRLLPHRFAVLRALVDRRSESGPETFMRLLLRAQGWHVDVQVQIRGVGRVDLVVNGWLIIECDSEAFHGDWETGKRDRRRDLQAARQGYVTLRPIAEDILFRTDEVLAAIRDAVAHHDQRVHNVANPLRRGGNGIR
ncbi:MULTISPECIES: type IV toxin-antitoxin system AbiEi family antitoxin domain-containing protein [unclassified Microbacterium]|uniref:type IV toxin-antitoxin system AbiEi family antitoxin domain-containing protein n=1 Tax=unclassified Microbacterium TaxID=2609290 RepID=UPI00214B800C|nr:MULTISPECIES: type IV toxin-antitoxin system AbiEi family antitoxin domain-containing protein [unclassified Microbacterium]MCR2785155.1 hypothetical protein [Microbacterium sp. zg.B96]WIM16688.1 hypothetical protein QNO11_03335 [Microbacterium sp. zg-B96]